MDTIIDALRQFFLSCPLMGEGKINVDFLPEKGLEYSIDTTPATEIVKMYADGSSVRQYLFVVGSVNDYGADTLQNLANSGFYEQFAVWLEQQTKLGNLPDLPQGKKSRSIFAQSTGYLFAAGAGVGKYQIQCKLLYFQEA